MGELVFRYVCDVLNVYVIMCRSSGIWLLCNWSCKVRLLQVKGSMDVLDVVGKITCRKSCRD